MRLIFTREDNDAAEALAENLQSFDSSKHVDIQFHFYFLQGLERSEQLTNYVVDY